MTTRLATVGLLALAMMAPAAAYAAPVPPTPHANAAKAGERPDACRSASTSAPCVNAWVADLDRAHAQNGLPDYRLPATFAALAPERQLLILANLDRIAYGLSPIAGLNSTLDADALTGARSHQHPKPSLAAASFGANMATDYDNAPAAYFTWMWADGPGGQNAGCPSAGAAACWGHRKTILRDGPQLMGAAMAPDAKGYGLLMVSTGVGLGSIGGALADAYTWDEAVAAGAGTNAYTPGHLLTIEAKGGTVGGAGGATGPCAATCRSFQDDGTPLTLTASPARGWVFLGWRGDACTSTDLTCTLTVTRDLTVQAEYALAGIKMGLGRSSRSAKVSGRVTPALKGRPVTVVFRRGAWKKTVTVQTRAGGVYVAKTRIPAGKRPVRATATFAGVSASLKL